MLLAGALARVRVRWQWSRRNVAPMTPLDTPSPGDSPGSPPARLGPQFEAALIRAAELHREQRRKVSETPYVAHLLSVAALVIEAGGSEDEAIAALLHDAVEDQGGAPILEQIRNEFGELVADIVAACSDADTTPKPPWRERKERHIEHVRSSSRSVRLVTCADKLHNARCVVLDLRNSGEQVWERFRGGREGSLWYYREMLAALQAGNDVPAGMLDELMRTVQQMHQLAGATWAPAQQDV